MRLSIYIRILVSIFIISLFFTIIDISDSFLVYSFIKKKATSKNIEKTKKTPIKTKKIKPNNKSKASKTSSSTNKLNKKAIKSYSKKNKKRKTNVSKKEIFQIIKCDTLTDGVLYKNYRIGKGRLVHSVHVLEANLDNPSLRVIPLKAGVTNYDLCKLHQIISTNQAKLQSNVIGAINGSFWRAYNNFPIGITVINGEVIEFLNHRNWSNALFDEKGKLRIDRVSLKGKVIYKKNVLANIHSVNRRTDSLGVVLYNKYGGDTIPYIQKEKLEEVIQIALNNEISDQIFEDSTEEAFDTLKFKQEMLLNQRSSMIEFPMKKISLEYLSKPIINNDIACKIISIDTGSVAVPENGCIVSLGKKDIDFNLKLGDTLILRFEIPQQSKTKFKHIISAIPRLVRNGIAKHEAYQEGSRGRRFINRSLPRTAIGTNRGRNIIYLVAVEGSKRSQGTSGASLSQMSIIMKKIGCYNAMNLDGGGSSTMVINNKNVLYNSNPEISRRISIGIGVIER